MPRSTNVISRFRRALERVEAAGTAGPSSRSRKARRARWLGSHIKIWEKLHPDLGGTDALVDIILRYFGDQLDARDVAIEEMKKRPDA